MKLKKWQLWTIVLVTLLIAVGLIWWNLYATNKTVITVLLVIDFLVMTFGLQIAIQKTFKFKPKPKHYNSITLDLTRDEILNNLKNNNYKYRKNRYGFSYMKIADKVAYKVTFIDDPEEYLKPIEGKEEEKVPGLDKCKQFIGFEIFLDYNDKILEKVPEFSFQGKNIYYEGFLIDKEIEKLIEVNKIEADPSFLDAVIALKNDLGVKENVDE